jgi:hypothetical protein
MKLMTSEAKVQATEPGRRERQRLLREQNAADAMAAAEARQNRQLGVSLTQHVADAQKKLDRPLAQARALFEGLPPKELDLLVLAETLGKNRKGVLNGARPSAAITAAYEQEARPVAPTAASE